MTQRENRIYIVVGIVTRRRYVKLFLYMRVSLGCAQILLYNIIFHHKVHLTPLCRAWSIYRLYLVCNIRKCFVGK